MAAFQALQVINYEGETIRKHITVTLKRPYYAFWGFPFPVVCYIDFGACKWSAKAKIPKFPV